MLSDKDRLTKAEKQIAELIEAKEKIERKIEIRDEIEKFVKAQDKGVFKYVYDIFRLLVILAIAYTGGNKLIDTQFVSNAIQKSK